MTMGRAIFPARSAAASAFAGARVFAAADKIAPAEKHELRRGRREIRRDLKSALKN